MDMADIMSAEGYGNAGYEYIIVDDCWLANERDKDGKLQPDSQRFPNGIKALADYVRFSHGIKNSEINIFIFRFITEVLSLVFMKIMEQIPVLDILEFWDI